MELSENVIVIDLEATCWENGKMPNNGVMEVIEIGICVVSTLTMEISNKQSIYVFPERSEISEFCTSLTGITSSLLEEKAISFSNACKKIKEEYNSGDCVWGSYGEFDRKLLQKQCEQMGVEYPMGARHINIKDLFALKRKLVRPKGLTKALRIINEPFEGIHHSGADDAYNTAKILVWMLKNDNK